MRVKVLASDIEKGTPISCSMCPIARAVKRMVKHTRVRVTDSFITVGAKTYRTPAIARRFVDRYDMGKTVKPITFSCQAE